MASSIRYNPPPIDRVSDRQGNIAEAFEIVRRCLREISRVITGVLAPPGSGGSGGGGAAGLATRIQHSWCANGPYRVDTAVDGGWVVPTAMSITSVKLFREVAGTAGTTTLDLNRKSVGSATFTSLYTTQSNRPAISYSDTDLSVDCALPDVVALLPDDVLWPDTDAKESGLPQNWKLTIEGS